MSQAMSTSQSPYRWVIVAAGGIMGCIAMGAAFALPVFITPMAESTGWGRTGISAAMTILFLTMAVGAMLWGALLDRLGPRPVLLTGAVLIAGSLALISQAPSLLMFQLIFGLALGIGVSSVFAPLMATVTGWFDTGRSLAVSLVSAGMGLAPMTMSPLAAWLVGRYDWRFSYLVLAVIVAVVMLPLSFLIRRPPALERQAAGQPAAPDADGPMPGMTVRQALTSWPFIILALTNFCCCATHSGPIFHTVSYAQICGIPLAAAVTIYSFEGLTGMGGRIAFGILGDRLGAKSMIVAGLLVQAVGALGYYFAHTLAEFYAVAGVFGFIYAGVMPLYAVLVRENFPLRMMGTIIGGTSMAGSLGMSTGPLLGGWIYDHTGDFGWMYISCFGIGLGAFAIATQFRPFPVLARQAGVAAA